MASWDWFGGVGLWNNPSNWLESDNGGSGVPADGDFATIVSSGEVTNNGTAVAFRLRLSASSRLTTSGSLTVGSFIDLFGGTGTATLAVTGGTVTTPSIFIGSANLTGLLTVSGGGIVTAAITVSNGSVIIGGTSPASAGTINGPISLSNTGTSLIFRTTNNAAYDGSVSGTGSILIDSAGRITTLTGDNSGHSGTTTVQAGLLEVGAAGTTGTLGTGDVILMNDTRLILSRSDTQLIANNISGAGAVDVRGIHTVILTGTNSYGTTFILEGNVLQIGDAGTTGTLGAGAVINDGALVFRHAGGTYSHANAISGSGNLVVRSAAGSAIEILTGNNSYTGTTSVESGILAVGQFGTSGTLGTGAVTVSSGAFLDLIRSDTQMIANTISGAGEVRVYGNHTAILTGNNSYGNTTIFAGNTLQIGNGGITGSLGTGAVSNEGNLTFNHSVGNYFHGNAIGGAGSLTVNGSGAEILSGVNSYTGVTIVNNTTLALSGAGSISNSSSLTLNGTGRFNIGNISGTSTSVRDVNLTGAGTEIALFGKTLIVTEANSFAGQGAFVGSGGTDAVIFNVASTNFTLAGANGSVFNSWTDGVDSITINGNASANILTGDELRATTINGGAGNDSINGGAGNDSLRGDGNNDTIDASAGGIDTISGGADDDVIIFGSALTALDIVDGGTGSDQVGISGTYTGGTALVLGANTLTNVEVLALLPGAGNSYAITSNNGNVAAGVEMTIFAGNLASGQNFNFNGSAETDGFFRTFGGLGVDTIRGGAQSDGFYFGPLKWDNVNDSVIGGGGTNDQLALDGNYTLTIAGNADVEVLVLLAGATPNTFNITLSDVWTGSGQTKTVFARQNTLGVTINGSSETNGSFVFFGGRAADDLMGGAGNDVIYGLEGFDLIRGGGGSGDIAVFQGARASYTVETLGGNVQIVDDDAVADGNDGTDTVVGIEFAQFSDQTISITSPIILDLDGGGVETLSAAQSNAAFDMDGDGIGDDTSWFGRGEGLLFLDRDGNGTLSNAGEMSFTSDVANARSDLEGLAAFDSNGDGQLSSADARFREFKIWRDRNGDGVVGRREIMTLQQAGVRSLSLTGTANNATTALGETAVVNFGSFTRTNGRQGGFIDAVLTAVSSRRATDQSSVNAMPSIDNPLTAMRGGMATDTFAGTGAPDISFDPRVTLMAQDMASFGVPGRSGISGLEQFRRFDTGQVVLFAV